MKKKTAAKKFTKKRRFTKSRLGHVHHAHKSHRSKSRRYRAAKRDSLSDTRFFKMKMTSVRAVQFAANQTASTTVFARFWFTG